MTEHNLGKASGDVELHYDGSEVRKAAPDLDAVAAAAERADKSTGKLNERLRDSNGRFVSAGKAASAAADDTKKFSDETARSTKVLETAGTAAEGRARRLADVARESRNVRESEKAYHAVLLDTRSTLADIDAAADRATQAKKRHARASEIAADADRAFISGLSVIAKIIPSLNGGLDSWSAKMGKSAAETGSAADKANMLSKSLGLVAKAALLLGQPEVAAGAEGVAKGIDVIDAAARKAVAGVKALAGFEVVFGKISGLALGITSLGGLAGLAGSSGVMGIVEIADAVKQLSGALGLLPAVISGVAFSAGTLQVAFHNVGSALTDMMADDPKKFLEDIKNMGPIAAQAMIGIAQFRDQFKLAGAGIQDSFFAQIAADIKPLIQTWLPAVGGAMAQVAGLFGQAAHQLAQLLQQPAAMQAFSMFVDNISAGLQALIPALQPLLNIFTQLTVVGSGFFSQIGDQITQILNFFSQVIEKAAATGKLQQWIQDSINGFDHLINIAYLLGDAFGTIMDVAERFGGGGLLGWLDDMAKAFDGWTQSADGQKSLTGFFTLMRQATDAFLPMLPPLLNGLGSIGTAFAQLGVATAPGWQTVFNTFAQVMAQLGPQIAATAPALNTFLTGVATSFAQLMSTIGPQLPQIFQTLADAFVALLPQLQPLAQAFIDLVNGVGPQLPGLFRSVTDALKAMEPYLPLITGLMGLFVEVLAALISAGATVIGWFTDFLTWVRKLVSEVPQAFTDLKNAIVGFFTGLGHDAENWGKNLLVNLAKGLADSTGISSVIAGASHVADIISDFWKTKSPAARGPLHDMSPNQMGTNVVRNFAAGITAAHPMVAAAAGRTAGSVASALSGTSTGGAPAAGGRSTADGALLPDNIASADTSILTAYLRHQFSDTRGLKGLAKDLGDALQVAQSGFNLATQQVMTPLLKGLAKVPGLNNAAWRKLSPQEVAAKEQSDMQKKALEGQKKGPSWGDVMGPSSSTPGAANIPLGLTPSSSKEDFQKAVIAAGKARGMNDGAIQTALAIAGAESDYGQNPAFSMQGGHYVGGSYQQGPAFGTQDQVKDPNYAINAFYDAFAKQLAANPTDPLLAGVLTQNPQLGGNAKGSDYWNAVSNQLGLANSIMGAYGKSVKGPSWAQLTGSTGAPGQPLFSAEGPEFYDKAFAHNKQFAKPSDTNYQSKLSTRDEQAFRDWVKANNVPFDPAAQTADYDMRGYWAAMTSGQVPGWTQGSHFPDTFKTPYDTTFSAESKYATPDNPFKWQGDNLVDTRSGSLVFGMPTSAAAQAITGAAGAAQAGYAGDASLLAGVPAGRYVKPGDGLDFDLAKGLADCSSAVEDLTNMMDNRPTGGRSMSTHNADQWLTDRGFLPTDKLVPGAFNVGFNPSHMQATLPGGTNFNWGSNEAAAARGINGTGAFDPAFTSHYYRPVGAGGAPGVGNTVGLVLPSGKSLDELTDNTARSASVNDQLLQAYLQGNPALAQQIQAAQVPGAADKTVQDTLGSITSTITTLKNQDAVGNKNTIDALQSTQSKIAQQQGFTQNQQGPVDAVSSILGSAGNAVTSVFQAIQGGLDSLTATQDITDRLVYGIRNTEDINKIVDDVQKYITFAADVANATGQILSTIGSIMSVANAGEPGGNAGQAVAAAGSIASMISGVLQGVNAAIDFGQQVYEITMSYAGRFMSYLTGLGGTELMGNVGFLLNKNTGQLLSYSMDNPQQKDVSQVPSWMRSWYDYNGKGNTNPGVGTLQIFAGPGQSPGEMLNETMWLVNSGGTTGALAAANF